MNDRKDFKLPTLPAVAVKSGFHRTDNVAALTVYGPPVRRLIYAQETEYGPAFMVSYDLVDQKWAMDFEGLSHAYW